jgi:hypothetical protein
MIPAAKTGIDHLDGPYGNAGQPEEHAIEREHERDAQPGVAVDVALDPVSGCALAVLFADLCGVGLLVELRPFAQHPPEAEHHG